MSVFSNVIKPQGLEPLQFPTKFRSHSGSEAVLGCEILNRMTALGRPVSYRIGR